MTYPTRQNQFNDNTVLYETYLEGEFDYIYNCLNGTNSIDLAIKGFLKLNSAGAYIADVNSNELIKFTMTGSAVNELTIGNAATGNDVTLSATGGDTNIGLTLAGKGTGAITFSSNPAGTILGSVYTPTPVVGSYSNVYGVTAYTTYYIRIGIYVFVSGRINIDPTTAAASSFRIDIPVASSISNAYELSGTITTDGDAGVGIIEGAPATNDALFSVYTNHSAARDYCFNYSYKII